MVALFQSHYIEILYLKTQNKTATTTKKPALSHWIKDSLSCQSFPYDHLVFSDRKSLHPYTKEFTLGIVLWSVPPFFFLLHFPDTIFSLNILGRSFLSLFFLYKLPCSQSHPAVVVFICWTILSFEMIHWKAMKHSEPDVWLTLQTATASWRRKQAPGSAWGEKENHIASEGSMCVFSVPSLPFLSMFSQTVDMHWGMEPFSNGEKPCQNHTLKKSSVLSAACSILALWFLRVSIAFPTTFFLPK